MSSTTYNVTIDGPNLPVVIQDSDLGSSSLVLFSKSGLSIKELEWVSPLHYILIPRALDVRVAVLQMVITFEDEQEVVYSQTLEQAVDPLSMSFPSTLDVSSSPTVINIRLTTQEVTPLDIPVTKYTLDDLVNRIIPGETMDVAHADIEVFNNQTTLVVTHNRGHRFIKYILVDADLYANNFSNVQAIIPNTVRYTSNSITFTFGDVPVSGTAILYGYNKVVIS